MSYSLVRKPMPRLPLRLVTLKTCTKFDSESTIIRGRTVLMSTEGTEGTLT